MVHKTQEMTRFKLFTANKTGINIGDIFSFKNSASNAGRFNIALQITHATHPF
jgi:hypothetical protein